MNEAKKRFTLNSEIASMKQKKPRFYFIVAKNGSKQIRADLAGDLTGDVRTFFNTIEAL
jgi:hypothetical protein